MEEELHVYGSLQQSIGLKSLFSLILKRLKLFSENVLASEEVVLDAQNTKKMTICMRYNSKFRSGPYKWAIVLGHECP
jgi:hypothetical protein